MKKSVTNLPCTFIRNDKALKTLSIATNTEVCRIDGNHGDSLKTRTTGVWYRASAHRNRSDFCDLRLRCPSRTPEIAAILETRESNAALRFKGAMESR